MVVSWKLSKTDRWPGRSWSSDWHQCEGLALRLKERKSAGAFRKRRRSLLVAKFLRSVWWKMWSKGNCTGGFNPRALEETKLEILVIHSEVAEVDVIYTAKSKLRIVKFTSWFQPNRKVYRFAAEDLASNWKPKSIKVSFGPWASLLHCGLCRSGETLNPIFERAVAMFRRKVPYPSWQKYCLFEKMFCMIRYDRVWSVENWCDFWVACL